MLGMKMKPPKRGICCVWTFRALGMSNNRFCLANRTIRGKTILPVKKQIQNAMIKEEFYKLKYCSTVVYMVPRA